MKHRFTFPVSKLAYNSWYEPTSMINDDPIWYTTSVPCADIPQEVRDLVPKAFEIQVQKRLPLFNFRSRFRPVVCGMERDNSDLAALRIKLDMMNIPLERLYIDLPGEIAVSVWEKTQHGRNAPVMDPWGTAIEAIRIDPSKVKVPTWAEIAAGDY